MARAESNPTPTLKDSLLPRSISPRESRPVVSRPARFSSFGNSAREQEVRRHARIKAERPICLANRGGREKKYIYIYIPVLCDQLLKWFVTPHPLPAHARSRTPIFVSIFECALVFLLRYHAPQRAPSGRTASPRNVGVLAKAVSLRSYRSIFASQVCAAHSGKG